MSKCKICFISGAIARSGGTERVGSIIANSLSERGYEVHMLSCWNHGIPHFPLNDSIQIHYLLNPKTEGKLYRTYLYPIIKMHNFIKKYNIDIIVDIDTELAIYSTYAISGTSCHHVSWEHFNYWTMMKLGEKKRFWAKKLIKKYETKLVVLTDEDRKKHMEVYNFTEKQIYTIHNPCLADVNAEYNFHCHIFVTVGRLVSLKGYDLLLQAWKIVEDTTDDWKLVIVGDGEDKLALLQLQNELSLKKVEFAGATRHVEDYYKKASCFVLSSRYEGFPMVILEAQSFALPVISFDCKTGPRDLIEDKVNGFLVEDGNVEMLAQCMVQFINDEQTAYYMSENTKKTVSQFNLNAITQQWEKLIADVLSN